MTTYAGRCDCGALAIEFDTSAPLAPRACQCSFCTARGARWVSDPAGSATLTLGADTSRYRFGTGTADFLICRCCGLCLAAVQAIDGATCAVLNLNAFDDPYPELSGERVDFSGESVGGRVARRKSRWTPATVIER